MNIANFTQLIRISGNENNTNSKETKKKEDKQSDSGTWDTALTTDINTKLTVIANYVSNVRGTRYRS
jgi:hypothetical protein